MRELNNLASLDQPVDDGPIGPTPRQECTHSILSHRVIGWRPDRDGQVDLCDHSAPSRSRR